MRLSQRHFFDSIEFHLGEEEFQYTIKTAGSKKRFSVDYMEFDSTPLEESEESNTWWRNLGIVWLAIGGIVTLLRYSNDSGNLRISFWLYLGLVCLAIYHFGKTSFTHHAIGGGGRVLLIKNHQAAAILRELASRRMVQLRETFGKVDFEEEPEREIAKFKWLQSEGAITSAEASARIQEVLVASGELPEEPTVEVN